MKKRVASTPTLLLVGNLLGCACAGCSSGKIEGKAEYIGGIAAVDVEIWATRPNTQSRSPIAKTLTDDSGYFKIIGLTPWIEYEVTAVSNENNSRPMRSRAGLFTATRLRGHMRICAMPCVPSDVDCLTLICAAPGQVTLIPIDTSTKVPLRVHAGLIESAFSRYSAFSVRSQDSARKVAVLSDHDYLIVPSRAIIEIARLFVIDAKTISLGEDGYRTIQGGLYYNVADFYREEFMIENNYLLKARVVKPSIEKPRPDPQCPNFGQIRADDLEEGYYLLTTRIATGQRRQEVLLGESHPKEGILIQVDHRSPSP
jgi:hypothetical protein